MSEQLGQNEILLEMPFSVGGKPVEKIRLRRPKARDLIAGARKKNQAEQTITILSNLSDVPVKDLEEMDLKDYTKLALWLEDFFPDREEN